MSSYRRLVLLIALGLTAALTATGPSLAATGRSNPLRPSGVAVPPRSSAPQGAVTAVVVKSWGNCSSGSLIWDDLNANWSSYGSSVGQRWS